MGTLQPVFAHVTQYWMEFMVQIGETPASLSHHQPRGLVPIPQPHMTSLSWIQVVPRYPGAPPTWYPGSFFHPSCLSSLLWLPQWLETLVSASLSSICEFRILMEAELGEVEA